MFQLAYNRYLSRQLFQRGSRRLSLTTIVGLGTRNPTINPRGIATKVTPFKLADIGEGIAEVELLKWYIKKG